MSVRAIEHRIADDQVVWAFGPDMTPVLEVEPGTVVTLAMKDGLNGQITREDQLVLDIRTAATGVSLVIPGVGQLHRAGLEARTKLFEVDGDTIHMNERISFPIRPMLGVMGVATGSEEVLNGFAGEHGGNLDNHLHGPGSRIYFPVRQPGGMFASSWPPRRPPACSSTSGASRWTRRSCSSPSPATSASRRHASPRRSRPSRAC